jgi:chain length determinant protein EpsF
MDSIRQVALILRARYKVALLVALLTTGTVMGVVALLPKRYAAEVKVMVDVRSPDPVSAILMPAMMAPGTLGTQIEIINSTRTARKVVRMLNLDENPTVKEQWREVSGGKGKLEDWLADLLKRGVRVTPARDSNILSISFQGGDPVFVTAVANAYAQAYIESSIELKVEPARQYARWFGDQAKVQRENVEKAQARLSEFQRQKGIVVTEDNLDYEVARLNDLSSRLTAIQSETRDAQSKKRSGSGTLLPEVQQSSVVAGLRTNIAQLEAKLKEAAVNLGSRHPQYQRMEMELAELKNRLEAETRLVADSLSSSTSTVGRSREAELMAAIEVQKKKLLQLRSGRDEIAVLVRDVDTAKKAYEAVTNRFNQTSLESQATQTNVSILTPAVEPLEPSFPKSPRVMLLLAILAGIVASGAAVFALELLDRRVRSAQDLADMLQLPVLGTIKRVERPRRLIGRSAVALLPR